MKLKRMRKETGDYGRGFSRWVNPTMNGYMMACCDCGLVHEMEFRAFKRGKVRKDGSYKLEVLGPSAYGVRLRARRAELYTRRERAKKPDLKRELSAKQALIDRLMLEYCPDEMTTKQKREWAKHQKPVREPRCRVCDGAYPCDDHNIEP